MWIEPLPNPSLNFTHGIFTMRGGSKVCVMKGNEQSLQDWLNS